MNAFVGVTLVSLIVAMVMLVIFKRASDQHALEQVKRKIQGCLFEIRLLGDDPRAILRAQSEIFRHSLSWIKLGLMPMVWILPPLVLVIAQLQSHYGYQVPAPGDTFVVEAQLTEVAASSLEGRRPDVALQGGGDGLVIKTPAVWIPAQRRLAWRVELRSPGDYELTLSLAGATATKSFDARPQLVRRSPLRVRSGFLDQLLYPAEPPLRVDGPFQSVSISLNDADLQIPGLGWSTHWTVSFFVLSIVFAFALKRTFGVKI
ncbi:MAG: hypothetical protein WBM40_07295 [Thiohalocapsa sp.]